MSWLRPAPRRDPDSQELLEGIARSLIFTTFGLYFAWHFVATLGWPGVFGRSLWQVTGLMTLLTVLSVTMLRHRYRLAQVTWLAGLAGLTLYAYNLYQRPEITILLVFLPLISIVTLGPLGTLGVEAALLGVMSLLPRLAILPALPAGYGAGVFLGSLFSAAFGWGLSNHLLSAIDAASYHYHQARRLLAETRQNQARISLMLKDQHQTNYQLERLNQMLHQARQRAEEARDGRDRFILAVSHELRSPLNFILGFSDLMVNSPETYADPQTWPPGLFDDVQEIYRSSTHLLGLINDILDMGQIDAHQMSIFREKVRIETIVAEVCAMVGRAFTTQHLYLRAECAPDLPEISVDITRIRQVLLNLLNNGLRFTEQGGVEIVVTRQEAMLQVRVSDTGPGIAPEDFSKVFDDFRQVGQENWRRREGSGLGLSISRRFVQLHGGRMWLESQLGQGSSFFFTLPLQETRFEPDIDPAATTERIAHQFIFERHVRQENLVVLLSPDPTAGQVLQPALGNYQLITISEVEQLPVALQSWFPRAVLVDRALLAQARPVLTSLPYPVPVLHLTLPSGASGSGALPAGVTDYLVKPITRQALASTVSGLGPEVRHLLVVDDDPAMLRFVTQALKTAEIAQASTNGYMFQTAFTGQEALQHLQSKPVDAILLDLDLPDMSGWEVLAQARLHPHGAHLPVVIVSAVDMPQMLYSGGQSVLDLWSNQPVPPAEFGALLKGVLDNLAPVFPTTGEGDAASS